MCRCANQMFLLVSLNRTILPINVFMQLLPQLNSLAPQLVPVLKTLGLNLTPMQCFW